MELTFFLDVVALLIGRIILFSCGVVVLIAICWIAYDYMVRHFVSMLSGQDLLEAIREWQERHPDKCERLKRRHDFIS